MDAARLEAIVQGANVLACLAIATFFLRGWTRSRDRFFLMFALAFAAFAANRAMVALMTELDEAVAPYLVRFAAFVLIAVAIVQKNREIDTTRSDVTRSPER